MEDRLKKHLLFQTAGTLFLAIFGAVYERFSHEVYSNFMLYAFLIPLAMGVLPYAVLLLRRKYPDLLFLRLWGTAIAVLSVGSVFAGVLAIYGTTNSLVIVYPAAGGLLILLAFASLLTGRRKKAGTARGRGDDPR